MTEAEWLASEAPWEMVRSLGDGVSDRKMRLFLCACCRSIWPFLTDERSRAAVEVAERFADGLASWDEAGEADEAAQEADEESDRLGATAAAYAPLGVGAVTACYVVDHAGCEFANSTVGHEEAPTTDPDAWDAAKIAESRRQAAFLRDIFGNPFRPVALHPAWLTANVVDLARAIYDERAFERLPILADALMDAGCDEADVLAHCRGVGPHARGCWVVDLLLGKE